MCTPCKPIGFSCFGMVIWQIVLYSRFLIRSTLFLVFFVLFFLSCFFYRIFSFLRPFYIVWTQIGWDLSRCPHGLLCAPGTPKPWKTMTAQWKQLNAWTKGLDERTRGGNQRGEFGARIWLKFGSGHAAYLLACLLAWVGIGSLGYYLIPIINNRIIHELIAYW